MVTFLCSAVALATLVQAPTPPPLNDSIAELRSRAERDSTDARLWLLMGRAYLELGADAHGATHRSSEDSTWVRAVVDTAETALTRAAALAGPLGTTAVGDSARVLRVGAWTIRSWLAWEGGGTGSDDDGGIQTWGPLPLDLRPRADEILNRQLAAAEALTVALAANHRQAEMLARVEAGASPRRPSYADCAL